MNRIPIAVLVLLMLGSPAGARLIVWEATSGLLPWDPAIPEDARFTAYDAVEFASLTSEAMRINDDIVADRILADGVGAAETRAGFAAPYPNPTSGHAAFNFAVPGHAVVSLDIIDVRGRRVRTIERSEMPAGAYRLSWDGRDQSSRPVGDGVYCARLRVTGPGLDETITRKVMLVR